MISGYCKSLISFSRGGDKAIIVSKNLYWKNQRCKFSNSREVRYLQELRVIQFEDRKPEPFSAKLTFFDGRILNQFYSRMEVKWAEFLAERNLCLIFDDHLLLLQTSGMELKAFFRIRFFPETVDQVFWGVYEEKLLFAKRSKDVREVLSPSCAEFFSIGEILEKIRENEEHNQESEKASLLSPGMEGQLLGDSVKQSSFETSK